MSAIMLASSEEIETESSLGLDRWQVQWNE